ncbi:MAG: ATP-dependent DNA helicase RecG, partial [Clostridiales bacterium]|nr:ATP-dependent DNA helicase RecG [Clostridiales bacterium]
MPLTRDTPLTDLPGIGPARAKKLEKLGLRTLGDTLDHLPQRYEDRRECHALRDAPEDRPCCVAAMVAETPRLSRVRKGLELVKARAVDHTGTLELTFFNQSYIKDALRPGESYVFYGTVERRGRGFAMTNPAFEREGAGRFTGLILPVYPLTAGISNNLLAGLTRRAVDECLDGLPEALPAQVRKAHQLCQTQFARKNIHYPASFEELAIARRRLVFEELFVLTCGLAQLKDRRRAGSGRALAGEPGEFAALLPFAPTGAQRRAMDDIAADLRSGRAMNRLVQGDVGSGKTAVAAFGAWTAAKNGVQCALMAPTELLAEQHARTLEALLSPAGARVALLTASVKGREKKALLSALAAGEIDLIVGTHALFSEGVEYHDLGLVIADEQHRFGVAQRSALAEKGGEARPHILVMSATPIPRTLALIIYGDLDVSVMDELPPGRTPVSTFAVGEDKRQRMYG